MAKRKNGDVCDRYQWQMKGAKRSGSNLATDELFSNDGRALVTTGEGNYE